MVIAINDSIFNKTKMRLITLHLLIFITFLSSFGLFFPYCHHGLFSLEYIE